MDKEREHRVYRVLSIYERLLNHEVLGKEQLADEFGVNNKTIQRDIEQIRAYLANQPNGTWLELVYSRKHRGYQLLGREKRLVSREEALAIMKVLLASRAFNEQELNKLAHTLLDQLNDVDQKMVKELIGNEWINYAPVLHQQALLERIWELSEIIYRRQMIEVSYIREDTTPLRRVLKPVGIIFSDFYFYLIAYMEESKYDFYRDETVNGDHLGVFRVDRILGYQLLNRQFYLPYSNRFEEGEFRKRIQFMFVGDLMKVKFEFYGKRIEHILDRLPTGRIIEKDDTKFVIEAEVYGKGIVMWLFSQTSSIKVLSPQSLVDEMKQEINRLANLYQS